MAERDGGAALVLPAALFVVCNMNGRGLANFDSQPTKDVARELLLFNLVTRGAVRVAP
jgi:hypothetical protein